MEGWAPCQVYGCTYEQGVCIDCHALVNPDDLKELDRAETEVQMALAKLADPSGILQEDITDLRRAQQARARAKLRLGW